MDAENGLLVLRGGSVDGHGDRRVVELQADELMAPELSAIDVKL